MKLELKDNAWIWIDLNQVMTVAPTPRFREVYVVTFLNETQGTFAMTDQQLEIFLTALDNRKEVKK